MAYHSDKRNSNKGDKKPFKKASSKFSKDKGFSSERKKSFDKKDSYSDKPYKSDRPYKKRDDGSSNYKSKEGKQFNSEKDLLLFSNINLPSSIFSSTNICFFIKVFKLLFSNLALSSDLETQPFNGVLFCLTTLKNAIIVSSCLKFFLLKRKGK